MLNPKAPPTGDIVVVELHVPAPTYAKLEAAAQEVGVSVERLFVLGLDHLLKQINHAEDAVASAKSPEELAPDAVPTRVAPVRIQQPSLPARVYRGHRHR
jgi:hypothetical protein